MNEDAIRQVRDASAVVREQVEALRSVLIQAAAALDADPPDVETARARLREAHTLIG